MTASMTMRRGIHCRYSDCSNSTSGEPFSTRFSFCPKCNRCLAQGQFAAVTTKWWFQFPLMSSIYALFMLKRPWPVFALLLLIYFGVIYFICHYNREVKALSLIILGVATAAVMLDTLTIQHQLLWSGIFILIIIAVMLHLKHASYDLPKWRWWCSLFALIASVIGLELLIFEVSYSNAFNGLDKIDGQFSSARQYYEICIVIWWWAVRVIGAVIMGHAIAKCYSRIRSLEIPKIIPDPPVIMPYPPVDWIPESKVSHITATMLRAFGKAMFTVLFVLTKISISAVNQLRKFIYWVVAHAARIADWLTRIFIRVMLTIFIIIVGWLSDCCTVFIDLCREVAVICLVFGLPFGIGLVAVSTIVSIVHDISMILAGQNGNHLTLDIMLFTVFGLSFGTVGPWLLEDDFPRSDFWSWGGLGIFTKQNFSYLWENFLAFGNCIVSVAGYLFVYYFINLVMFDFLGYLGFGPYRFGMPFITCVIFSGLGGIMLRVMAPKPKMQ